MTKFHIVCFLLIVPASLGLPGLLEMSQTLWTKLLSGGLSNIGSLDPLRVPIVKVDQSQGDTNYRMTLTNIEIRGLNDSRLESIHVGRGSVKSNLTEGEAGYVSYNDRNAIDFIRYRFHTVIKEPNSNQSHHEDLRVESIERNNNRDSDVDNHGRRYGIDTRHEGYNKYQETQQRYSQNEDYNRRYVNTRQREQQEFSQTPQQQQQQQHRQQQHHHHGGQSESMPQQESFVSQAQRQRPQILYNENNYQRHQQVPQIEGYRSRSGYSTVRSTDNDKNNSNRDERGRYLIYAQTQPKNQFLNGDRSRDNYEQISPKQNVDSQHGNRKVEIKYPTSSNSNSNGNNNNNNNKPCDDVNAEDVKMNQRKFETSRSDQRFNSGKLENQPDFIDIVYADENSKKMRHFGNLRIEPRGDKTVYSLEDVMRDLDNHRRFIIHNFTESELMSKKNDKLRTAEETRRIKDIVRYAKEFQEKQGYFEEGMELIYHYGNGSETKVYDGKRMKRAHEQENENEDDIMHVIIKIRVPLLRVKAGYVLIGKVGDQVLRGNGQLNGNFTELIGDFTVELKKSNDKTMTVRAARAKLQATDQDVKLEGIDDKDAVKAILNQGLVAAEAVAAMLADDLATKALNESTADAMIYRMYKELSPN